MLVIGLLTCAAWSGLKLFAGTPHDPYTQFLACSHSQSSGSFALVVSLTTCSYLLTIFHKACPSLGHYGHLGEGGGVIDICHWHLRTPSPPKFISGLFHGQLKALS